MNTLAAVALRKLKKTSVYFFSFLLIAWITGIGIISFYFKSNSLNSTLDVTVNNLGNIASAGDWALAMSYLDVLKSNNIHSIELKYNNQIIAGPILLAKNGYLTVLLRFQKPSPGLRSPHVRIFLHARNFFWERYYCQSLAP